VCWYLLPTLFLPILCVTPRRDRGVQGHTARAERFTLDSAITSRNYKCKSGDKIPPLLPHPSGLTGGSTLSGACRSGRCYGTAEPPTGAVLTFQGEWALRSSRRDTGGDGEGRRPAPYPSNASQGGTGLKVVTRWSIIRRTLAESALPGG
jgi:hypothetical protein